MTKKTLDSKTSRHGDLYVRANFSQASDSIKFAWGREAVDEERWSGSPYQVADARHSRRAAAKLIRNWNRSNYGW